MPLQPAVLLVLMMSLVTVSGAQVKVDSVRVATGAASIVYLRILDTENLVLPVHIGAKASVGSKNIGSGNAGFSMPGGLLAAYPDSCTGSGLQHAALGCCCIGEAESSALLKEINKQRQQRPLTHDVARNL
jgi:bifunctional DNase/RNase